MSLPVLLISLVLVALVVLIISAPLRSKVPAGPGGSGADPSAGLSDEQRAAREDLEAEREAKYREIRDAELDYRTGKLSQEDYRAIDGALRTQALEILNRLEAIGPQVPREGSHAGASEDSAPARPDR